MMILEISTLLIIHTYISKSQLKHDNIKGDCLRHFTPIVESFVRLLVRCAHYIVEPDISTLLKVTGEQCFTSKMIMDKILIRGRVNKPY